MLSKQILLYSLDTIVDPIFITDELSNFVYVNNIACQSLGYTSNELLHMNVLDIDPNITPPQLRELREKVKVENIHAFQTKHQRKNGEIFPVELAFSCLKYKSKTFFLSIAHNITKRKKEQQLLTILQTAIDHASDAVYIIDHSHNGRFLYTNKMATQMLGYTKEEFLDLYIKDIDAKHSSEELKYYSNLDEFTIYTKHKAKNGEILDVKISASTFIFDNIRLRISLVKDMRQQLKMEAELLQRKEEFQTLVETAPGMIGSICVKQDYSAYIPYVSPNIYELYGITPQDVKNDILPLLKLHHPSDVPKIKKDIYRSLQTMNIWSAQYRIEHPTKGERWVQCTFKPNPQPGGAVIFHGFVIDITEQKENEKEKEFLAFYDPLTKLPNRILTADRIKQALAQAKRDNSMLAILFIDLDNFKTINDSIGHSAGDKVIQAVAKRLTAHIRQNDTVSRHGGDEFLLVATNVESIGDVTKIAQKVIDLFKEPFYTDDYVFTVSASIGISMYPDSGKDYSTLLKEADLAMYKAKERGKNTFEFSEEGSSLQLLHQLKIQNKILDGIKQNEFELYYQPQVELSSGNIIGVEALIRWNSKELGFLHPVDFISIAETSGHIIELGKWIIQEACNQGALWQKDGKKLIIAINISALQFQRGDLITTISKALAKSQFDPKFLELEITESVMMNNAENVLADISVLKELGIHLSIDDFGTGYSSLSYLKRFSVDKLKIDRSFIINLLHDNDDKIIVKSIIQMAKSLGLRTIAEGVEDKQTVDLLKELGCDEIQGYYFAKPMNVKNFQIYCKEKTECKRD
jgi:diguanylate cyclase (GGDEF)-like protein/PAS domain S-box-containing protein